ncbi:hypothetical protein PILCRDRAFT_759711 [Piloderma croceum F 1598]|uniref:Uncharacterized protein n=1 Tax=Piloderma croceum (strain F 1598) TaxID=765440 RepID=A0A0C3ABK0_PILCF|nr:hypothetical protein PILCRDRAFT_759711 [Piloderma croceum F 1598]
MPSKVVALVGCCIIELIRHYHPSKFRDAPYRPRDKLISRIQWLTIPNPVSNYGMPCIKQHHSRTRVESYLLIGAGGIRTSADKQADTITPTPRNDPPPI